MGILSFTIRLNICGIISGMKKYKLIIKKKKKKHYEIVLSGKTMLNCIIYCSLIKSYISLYDFDSMNDVLRNMI